MKDLIEIIDSYDFGIRLAKSKQNLYYKIYELKQYFNDKASIDFFDRLIARMNKDNDIVAIENNLKKVLINHILPMYLFDDKKRSNGILQIYNMYHNINLSICMLRVKYQNDKKSYKVYPNFIDEDEDIMIHNVQLIDYVLDIFLNNSKRLDDICNLISNNLKEENDKKIANIKNGNLEPYCGNVDFMKERCIYILECVDKVILSSNINEDIKNKFLAYYEYLVDMVQEIKQKDYEIANKVNNNDVYNSEVLKMYDDIEKNYKRILSIENELSLLLEDTWNQYLTNLTNYKDGDSFKFIVHGITSGYVEAENMYKACCTLVTDQCLPIPYSDYGYIMMFDMNQVGTMCTEDAGSWIITREEFIERYFPDSWQLFELVDNRYVFYEYPKLSKLILPWDMEKEMYVRNEKYSNAYTEIFLRRTDNPLKSFAFFTINAEGKRKVDEIIENNKLLIPVISFDDMTVLKKK